MWKFKDKIRKYGYEEKVNEYYDLVTKGYREVWGSDYFHPFLWPDEMKKGEALAYTHNYVFEKMKLHKDAIIADYGCGIGSLALLLAPKAKHVTAINFNKKQLGIARQSAKNENVHNVEFIKQDIMKSDFKEKFDFIFMWDVEPHLPDKKEALRILHRALKSGGRLMLSAWLQPEKPSLAAKYLIIDPFNRTWAFPFMETHQHYISHFEKIGFKIIVAEDWTKNIGKSVRQGYEDFLKTVNTFSIKDVAKVLDASSLTNPKLLLKKAREMTKMVLYSQAAYDSGNFLHYIYIVEKDR